MPIKTQLRISANKSNVQLMRADARQIVLAISDRNEIRIVVMGTIGRDGEITQEQVGANWVVNDLKHYTALEIGSVLTIEQK